MFTCILCFDKCNQVTSVVFKLFLHIMYTIVQMELRLSFRKPLRGYYVFKMHLIFNEH